MVCNDARAKAEEQALAYLKQMDDDALALVTEFLRATAERQKSEQPAEKPLVELLKKKK